MANAWCINAIWFDWCLIRTLENLDSSNIWVWVQFTAPNPLDDKRFDYIKYTDKNWNTCCLTWENEILIYATNWTIKNLTLTNDDTNEVVNVKRSDVFWSNRKKTVVRYKTWWYPTSITDWTLAVEELVMNQYASTWFNVEWLEDWTTYYFSVFAVAQDDTIIVVQTNSITTEFIKYRLITDFRNYSSLAQLQQAWRTNTFRNLWNIQFSYWSTWMKFTSSWYWWIYATIPFAISWTNKIHFKLTWNWNTNSAVYSNICSKNTPDLGSNDMTEVCYRLPFSWKQDQWMWCNKSVWSTKYRSIFNLGRTSYNWVNWNFEYEFDIDLNTDAISWKCSAPSSAVYEMSWTLNTEWRNAIIWTKFLCLRFANYSSATNYLYTSELIIR